MSNKIYKDLNEEYNCDINLCVEDILNLIDCLDAIKENMIIDIGHDLFPLTIKNIIERWEEKIGKKAIDINNHKV